MSVLNQVELKRLEDTAQSIRGRSHERFLPISYIFCEKMSCCTPRIARRRCELLMVRAVCCPLIFLLDRLILLINRHFRSNPLLETALVLLNCRFRSNAVPE